MHTVIRSNLECSQNIEAFRLPVRSTNALYRLPHGNGWVVAKVYRPYPLTARHLMGRFAKALWQPATARYGTPAERCAHERKILGHWAASGFAVPRLLDVDIERLAHRIFLVMEHLEGCSVGELLRQERSPEAARWALVDMIFDEMSARHRRALQSNDASLAHLDANTGNVILCQRRLYRVDFESSFPGVPVIDLLAREVFKLCRWIVRDMGRSTLGEVIERLMCRYRPARPILEMGVERTRGRAFSWWHRRRDRVRKRRNPETVTKYDLCDRIAVYL